MGKIFEEKLKELGITLTDIQKQQFVRFYELLVEWNKVMNLTGITEYEEVNEKHFVDSLSIVKAIDINKVETVNTTLKLTSRHYPRKLLNRDSPQQYRHQRPQPSPAPSSQQMQP